MSHTGFLKLTVEINELYKILSRPGTMRSLCTKIRVISALVYDRVNPQRNVYCLIFIVNCPQFHGLKKPLPSKFLIKNLTIFNLCFNCKFLFVFHVRRLILLVNFVKHSTCGGRNGSLVVQKNSGLISIG